MKILVTGAGGFLGSHVVELLVDQGHSVVCMLAENAPENYLDHSLEVTRLTGDIRDESFVGEAVAGCQQVYHLAAAKNRPGTSFEEFFSVNVLGTKNVMAAALEMGVDRVVNTSSIVTIKEDPGPVDETSLHRGFFSAAYTLTKYKGEKVCFEYGAQGLDVVVVNPTIMFGPRDTGSIAKLLKRHLESKVRIVGFPDCQLNLIYVKNAAIGHVLAMEKGKSGHKYILGGNQITIGDLVGMLDKVANINRPTIRVPDIAIDIGTTVLSPIFSMFGKTFPLLKAQVKAMRRGSAVDFSKAQDELGLPVTPIEADLESTLDWYRQTGFVKC
jgi:dihydroflavonol-4-reductase